MRAPALLGLLAALLAGGAGAAAHPQVDEARLLDETPAPRLSDYHLFTDAGGRRPNAGLTPFTVATPLFSDYAAKQRYLYMPPGTKARFTASGPLEFPVGAALIKTFSYPADFRQPDRDVRLIETRLLIHRQDGWAALTYVWNADQDEATLKRAGLRTPVSFIDAQGRPRRLDYAVPDVNQCKECHSQNGVLTPLGPKARNLNVPYAYAGGTQNQLAHWTAAGLLAGAPSPATLTATPRWDDPHATLEARARAYLDANCAHCHSRAGLASNSGLYLTLEEADPSALGVGKRPIAAGRGSGGLLFSIDPGHPDQSFLLYRMASAEPGVMMPQIGRTVAHEEGLDVIRAYIAAMPPTRK